MWVFFDFGLLMPAIVDDNLRLRPDWAEYSENGRFDFQVRSRLIEHAQYFMDEFMEKGTYGPILHTPDHDYNYRFYTTREAYADGMREAIMAIDYRKFKPSSERYVHGKKYHGVLNSIWVDVCDLNGPGGAYGPRSPENPHGYDSVARLYSRYGDGEYTGRRIGDSFLNIDFGDDDNEEDEEWYEPSVQSIIDELHTYGIDEEDWALNLTPNEFDKVSQFLTEYLGEEEFERQYALNREVFNIEVV